jgi:hypothetical protein
MAKTWSGGPGPTMAKTWSGGPGPTMAKTWSGGRRRCHPRLVRPGHAIGALKVAARPE